MTDQTETKCGVVLDAGLYKAECAKPKGHIGNHASAVIEWYQSTDDGKTPDRLPLNPQAEYPQLERGWREHDAKVAEAAQEKADAESTEKAVEWGH